MGAEGTISCAQSVAIVTPNATATAMDHQLLKRLQRRTTTAVASIAALPAPLLLSTTIALEILATTSMKFAEANARWYLGVFGGYCACFSLFPLVVRKMPLGVAYATWCSVGMVLTTLFGAFCFGEALNGPKVMSILLVVLGVIGLNFVGGGHLDWNGLDCEFVIGIMPSNGS